MSRDLALLVGISESRAYKSISRVISHLSKKKHNMDGPSGPPYV